MYRKTDADIGFTDETPKRSSVRLLCTRYDHGAPFVDGLFRDAAPSCLEGNRRGVAHKRNF